MSDAAVEGLGLTAGTLTTLAFLPQVIQIWRLQSARGVSLAWIIIFSTGVFLWFIYGLISNAPAVFIATWYCPDDDMAILPRTEEASVIKGVGVPAVKVAPESAE